MWRRMYARGYTARPDVSLVGVMSGIEMACWDIVGKAVDKPVYELLGGRVHERLRAYTYLYTEEDDRVGRLPRPGARGRAGRRLRGARASPRSSSTLPAPTRRSTRGSPSSRRSIARRPTSRAFARPSARAATCSSARTGSSPPPGAIRLARRLEQFDPLWFEEPVPPDLPEEMATVARATSIPIATGERLTTKYEFARVLATGAARILQPNLGRCRRDPRGQEDRRARRGALRPDRAASLLRPGRRRREHPARRLQPELPRCSRGSSTGAASTPSILRRADRLGGRLRHPPDRARARRRARRGGRGRAPVRRATSSTSRPANEPLGFP